MICLALAPTEFAKSKSTWIEVCRRSRCLGVMIWRTAAIQLAHYELIRKDTSLSPREVDRTRPRLDWERT